jgi:hypothetical protein
VNILRPRIVRIAVALLVSVSATSAMATVFKDMTTSAGLIGLSVSNLGYFGNAFFNRNLPSGEYPRHSRVEHIYRGGIWVGARGLDGSLHVSTGAQDANGLQEGDNIREFKDFYDREHPSNPENFLRLWSNSQNADNYNPAALATEQFELFSDDYTSLTTGNHVPLGVKVRLRVLSWGNPFADDFVILDYSLINVSGGELRDVYLGLWTDTTVGNTDFKDPYDGQAINKWDFWGGQNGAFGPVGLVDPAFTVPSDPNIWLSYEHDADGDEGMATSWVGVRLLGTSISPAPVESRRPVSFNLWRFKGVPERDDQYDNVDNPGQVMPGKYQFMSNGEFDVGDTPDGNYSAASNWVSMMSTGPFPTWAPDDTLSITFAVVAAPDSVGLLSNSKVAQVAFDEGFTIPSGPPSPRLAFGTENNSVVIGWAAGDSLYPPGDPLEGQVLPVDSPLRSPEHHISLITRREDFQGYRIYRYQGTSLSGDPFRTATLVAQFDKIDGIGFDTGLPPKDENGRRRFVDSDLLDGSPYWYAVTTFSAPDIEDGLPEFESGFNENSNLVYPGSAASDWSEGGIGVYPNPYRAASMFDVHTPSGVSEIGRKIWFTGLPARSRIDVFTLAGDLVKSIEHDNPNSGQEPWDLISEPVRAIASGLYIYVVTDLETGQVQRGKLVIIK